ncbi:MAG: hypothetical protein NTX03_04725 [Bacteroidetes bacterium]|nr:hypothetical protein [Bacteroidota bacterium]
MKKILHLNLKPIIGFFNPLLFVLLMLFATNSFAGYIKVGPARIICNGESVQLGEAAIKGNTYTWSSNPSGFSSTLSNPMVTQTANTWYFLTEMDSVSGKTATDSVWVSIATLTANPTFSGSTKIPVKNNDDSLYSNVSGVYPSTASLSYLWSISPSFNTTGGRVAKINDSIVTNPTHIQITTAGCYDITLTIHATFTENGNSHTCTTAFNKPKLI